ISATHGRTRLRLWRHTLASSAAFFTASAARSIRHMKFSILTTSFRSLELLLSKTAWLCEKLRHKSRSGNSWLRPIAHIWRLSLFAGNALNQRIHGSWQKRSPRREKSRCKRLPRRQPKPRKGSFSSIGHEHEYF